MAPLAQGKNGSKAVQAAIDAASALPTYAVAGLPSAASMAGKLVYVSNGSAGQPALAFSTGSAWKLVALGAAPSAS